MTEHRTNAEIEDVLSSIRRLVSDDIRPSATATAAPAPAPAIPARPRVPRLVLTSALRVDPVPVPPVAPEPPSAPAEPPVALSTRLAELETLLAAQEPGSFEDDHLAVIPPVWTAPDDPWDEGEAPFVDDATAVPGQPPSTASAHPAVASDIAEADDDDAPAYDDAVLREIVRDVLREELQGAMGERVTRNLRKLIRAEVARALTARGIA